MPNLDPRTYTIIALSAALLAIVLFVPAVREWAGGALVAIGLWLGGKKAKEKTGGKSSGKPDTEPVTAADEADAETQQAVADEKQPTDEELKQDFEEIAQ